MKGAIASWLKDLGGRPAETSGMPGHLYRLQSRIGNLNAGLTVGSWKRFKVDAPIHLDDLLETLEDISPSELIAALFELEMLGLVKQLPGKNFVKVW